MKKMITEQALILAGGFGRRLGNITKDVPKPLLPVGGRVFLEHLIWNLKRHGIRKILLSVGYLANRIQEHFGDGSDFGVSIEYVVEDSPAGTGGALKLAADWLDEWAFVLNGDTLFDINYLDLALAVGDRCLAAMALREVDDCSRFGKVLLQGQLIKGVIEKAALGPGKINAGVYLVNRRVLDYMEAVPCSLERDVFLKLADEGLLVGRSYNGLFIDIGVPESLARGQKILASWQRKGAIFIDRDGTLNVDRNYVNSPERFEWIAGAPEAVKWLNDHGYLVIVITNQAGIAHGYYSEQEFRQFSDWINDCLAEHGAHIDAVYYCPHHPEHGNGDYKRICDCRKPGSGMIEAALGDWDIDPSRSLMIGDKDSDVQAAHAAGIRGELFDGGNLIDFLHCILS